MSFGEKIKKLRIESGLTQKQLADKMSVSFQTVSKWESNLNEPDIATIKLLSKIFNCSIEYLFSESDSEETINEESMTNVTVAIPIEYCCECGDALIDDTTHIIEKRLDDGRKEVIKMCDSCYKEKKADLNKIQSNESSSTNVIKTNEQANKTVKAKKGYRSKVKLGTTIKWSIALGIIGFIIALICCVSNYADLGLFKTILIPVAVCYVIVADIYCIFTYTWVSDVFENVSEWSVRFPGIIFSFDLDGLKFLILMKVLFFLIGIIVSILTFFLALFLSSICSIFTFPFVVGKNE